MSRHSSHVLVRVSDFSRHSGRRLQGSSTLGAARKAALEISTALAAREKPESTPDQYPQGYACASMEKGMPEPRLFGNGTSQATPDAVFAAA